RNPPTLAPSFSCAGTPTVRVHRDQDHTNHGLCPYLNTLPRVLETRRIQALEMRAVMTGLIRGAGLVIIAVALAGCGSNAAGSAGAPGSPAPASSSAAPQTAATVSPAAQPADVSRACQQPGKYLTAVRTAKA